jgi:hypothetical protein
MDFTMMHSLTRRDFLAHSAVAGLFVTGCASIEIQEQRFLCQPQLAEANRNLCNQLDLVRAFMEAFTMGALFGLFNDALISRRLRELSNQGQLPQTQGQVPSSFAEEKGRVPAGERANSVASSIRRDNSYCAATNRDLNDFVRQAEDAGGSISREIPLREQGALLLPVAETNVQALEDGEREYQSLDQIDRTLVNDTVKRETEALNNNVSLVRSSLRLASSFI